MTTPSRALPALPLRLAAEPPARSVWPSCVALAVHAAAASHAAAHGSLEVAVLVDDDGIEAFAFSAPVSRRVFLDYVGFPHSPPPPPPSSSDASSSDGAPSSTPRTAASSDGWRTGPILCLVRTSPTSNDMGWHVYRAGDEFPTRVPKDEVRRRSASASAASGPSAFHDAFVARLLTESIRLYYAQQVLEPSVRGFLSVLEKQFARSDLYLFELLQNAVDDGASVVRFSSSSSSRSRSGAGGGRHNGHGHGQHGGDLRVAHNGRRFTPLDVLGLSSVGLSTKSREGKRTIGFMGVGFKAVYKRFSRVVIDDGTYAFAYERPTAETSTSPGGGYGWVMQPLWIDEESRERPAEGTENWCRFHLERPAGGMAAVDKDLSVLPPTAPPLLGRAALEKGGTSGGGEDRPSWTLDWNGRVHSIRRIDLIGLDSRTAPFSAAKDRSEVVTVDVTDRSGHVTRTRWLFLSHKYVPSRAAADSYRSHTKRSHSGEEEVCGFVRLGGKDGRTPLFRMSARSGSLVGGIVHSVLPTKLRMPVPMNVQGAWLLSVDRQEVQDLGDNEWNRDLVHRLPILIANFFRWAAKERLSTVAHYEAICKLLPAPVLSPSSTSSSTEFLGQTVSLGGLERVLYSERVLPVALPPERNEESVDDAMDIDNPTDILDEKPATGYYEGECSIWVPPSWFKFLGADFLRGWLGRRPLRTDLLGEAAYHPLFSSNNVIGQLSIINTRNQQLAREVGVGYGKEVSHSSIGVILCLMASIGAAYNDHSDSKEADASDKKGSSAVSASGDNGTKANAQVCSSPAFCASMTMTSWSVFLTEHGELSTLDKVVLPADDFANAPENLRVLLRPFFIPESTGEDAKRNKPLKKGNKRERNRGAASTKAQRVPQKRWLHPLLEAAIYKVDSGCSIPENVAITKCQNEEDLTDFVASFLSRCRADAPSNTINVATAAANLMTSYSKLTFCREEHMAAVLCITEYALSTNNPSLLSYVLVDTPPPSSEINSSSSPSREVKLIVAREAYIGRALDESGPGADLETFSGKSLRFVSSVYSTVAASAADKQKLLKLFDLAGVQSGLSATITAIVDLEKSGRQLLTSEIIPHLPEKKLPKTRKNPTKSTLYLPYGLCVPMDKRRYSLIDAELPQEWEKIVNAMPPEAAAGFIALLLAIPTDDAASVTAKTTPAAAKLLAGQSEVDANEVVTSPAKYKSVRIAKDTAVPLRRRLFFLPPGQPGGASIDTGTTKIVKQLSTWKWLPCRIPSQSDTAAALTLCRPEEALLSSDISRPEMPVIQLSPALLKRLSSSSIAKALVWGTRAPPPPLTRLAELAREADILVSSCTEGKDSDLHSISRLASELVSTWMAIARAHLRGDGLSASDRKKLRSICEVSHCMPIKRALNASNPTSWIVPVSRCVLMPESLGTSASDGREKIKRLTVASFVASNFMHDFHDIKSNPFFSQPDVSGVVIQLANIATLSSLPPRALTTTSGAFVRYCCSAEPVVSRSSPLRASFSFAMKWCMESPNQLPEKGLKLFVRRGPGIGSKALPARWIPIKNGSVQPVLDDDKSRTRYSLLTPEMSVQLLGVLDHIQNERECPDAEILSAIDRDVVDYCGVLRLSGKGFHVRTKARGRPTIVDGASFKLQLACALLKTMELDRIKDGGGFATPFASGADTNSAENFLDPKHEPPEIIRHESLTREFQAPGMNSPSLTPLYAVWGRAPKHISSRRCILVSGEPEDYSVELEQLVLNHVGIRLGPSLASTKDYRAALRLLSHLESNASFEKFLARDFSDSEIALRWRKLRTRSQVLDKLKEAEREKEAEALRNALIEAEEACEDDDDEGDAVLGSARELLSKLEDEIKSRREAEEREKAQERERNAAREAALKKEKEAFEQWKQDEKDKALSKMAGDAPKAEAIENSAAPRGRGRGLTLPAWVTSGAGPSKAVIQKADKNTTEAGDVNEPNLSSHAMQEAKSLVSSIISEGLEMVPNVETPLIPSLPPTLERDMGASNLPSGMPSGREVANEAANPALQPAAGVGRGQGRGVVNLPAWMTSGNAPAEGGAPDAKKDSFADAEENVLKCPRPEENPAPQPAAGVGRGRGRGVVNLPAWMTSGNAPAEGDATDAKKDNFADAEENVLKRPRPEEKQIEGKAFEKDKPSKKARTAANSFKFLVQVSMEEKDLPEFIAWLRPSIEEKVKRHNGSVTLDLNEPMHERVRLQMLHSTSSADMAHEQYVACELMFFFSKKVQLGLVLISRNRPTIATNA